jgi:proline dehydrogenase
MSVFDSLVRATLPVTPRPVVHFFARRYVAGSRLEQAIATVQRLAQQGCCATIDVLGESVVERQHAVAAVAAYYEVLEAITANSLPAHVSLKPTQMGLNIDRSFCRDNIAAVLERARTSGIFVRIDMEDSPTTDATLAVYRELVGRYPGGTGVVLQARLRRTFADAAALASPGTNVRLCKGIYLEPRPIAYEERDIIRSAFVHALELLLEGGAHVGIASQSSTASDWPRTATSSRCCSASTRSCGVSSPTRAIGFACMSPSGRTGTRTRSDVCARTRPSPAWAYRRSCVAAWKTRDRHEARSPRQQG